MGQLSKATQQNASASEELAATSEELSGQAEQLQQAIAFFHSAGGDAGRRTVVDFDGGARRRAPAPAATRPASSAGSARATGTLGAANFRPY
jgi:methyl-accepting chemotaxis protein